MLASSLAFALIGLIALAASIYNNIHKEVK